jgi:hypothetical protein
MFMTRPNTRSLTLNGASSTNKVALFEAAEGPLQILYDAIERLRLPAALFRVKQANLPPAVARRQCWAIATHWNLLAVEARTCRSSETASAPYWNIWVLSLCMN